MQVCTAVVKDLAGESYWALGALQVELQVHVGVFDHHDTGPFEKAQIDVTLLLRRHHLLHLLLQLDQLPVDFTLLALELFHVNVSVYVHDLVLVCSLQLLHVLDHQQVVELNAIRHVSDAFAMVQAALLHA